MTKRRRRVTGPRSSGTARPSRRETRPTKTTDSRSKRFSGESVEVDAIPSSALRDLVYSAISQWIDVPALRLTEAAELSERAIFQRMVGRTA